MAATRLDALFVLNPVVCIKAIERHRIFALKVTILRFCSNLVLYDSLKSFSDEQYHAVETLLEIGLRYNLESDLFFILTASVTPRLLLFLLLVLSGRYICSDRGIPLKGWRVRHISRIKRIDSLHLRQLSFHGHLLAVLNDILKVYVPHAEAARPLSEAFHVSCHGQACRSSRKACFFHRHQGLLMGR